MEWQHLEERDNKMYVRGTDIKAEILYIQANSCLFGSREALAKKRGIPLPAVQEACDWYKKQA